MRTFRKQLYSPLALRRPALAGCDVDTTADSQSAVRASDGAGVAASGKLACIFRLLFRFSSRASRRRFVVMTIEQQVRQQLFDQHDGMPLRMHS